jgi:undecaprenyl-diphosphatase
MQSSKAFNKSYLKKLPLRLILLLGLFAATIYLFVIIIHEVFWEEEVAMDNSIFSFLSANVINNQLTGVMKIITHMASSTFLQISYGILIFIYLIKKNWKRSVEIAAIAVGGFLLNYIMKISFRRIRPPDPLVEKLHNFSFPSGHATSAFIFYGLLTYLVWKSDIKKIYKIFLGLSFILFSLLIGFSRIYLRVHYPSDVVAGFCIGFAWLSLCIWLMEYLKKKSDKELPRRTANLGKSNNETGILNVE